MRRFLSAFAAACTVIGAFFYASFFVNLESTLSNFSGFGFMWPLQLFYNFLHGRPFQSSIYATDLAGVSVGFTHNPDAFIHANVIHVNWLPYLFSYAWALHPTPAWFYGLIFAWNLAGGALFTVLILRKLSPKDSGGKIAFALGLPF